MVKGKQGSVVSSTLWLYADQVIRASVSVLVFGLVTRSLGTEGFGLLAYAVSFPAIFLPLAGLGLDHVLIRDFVRHPERRDEIFATGLCLKAAAALIACVLSVGTCIIFISDSRITALIAVSSLSIVFQPMLTLDYFFQSQIAARRSAIARLLTCFIGNGVRAWLTTTDHGILPYVWLMVGEAALYSGILFLSARDLKLPWSRLVHLYDGRTARLLLAASLPLFLADIAIAGYMKLDQIVLGHLAGLDALGSYAAAMRLSDYTAFVAMAVINTYFPRVVAHHQAGGTDFPIKFRRFGTFVTYVGLTTALGVTIAAPWLAELVIGPEFSDASAVFVALSWANLFAVQIAVRGKLLLLENLQWFSLAFFASGALIHLSLLYVVAPRWGALGAASSLFVAQLSMLLLAPLMFKTTRRFVREAVRWYNMGILLRHE